MSYINMIWILVSLSVTMAASLAFVIAALRKAPEGYEDAHGFDALQRRPSGAGVSRAAKPSFRGVRRYKPC
jgi:hypothetical protein